GSAWTGSGGYSTADKTLVRKSTVTGGITVNPTGTGAGAFTTLTTEWDLFNQDDVSNLGAHTFDSGSTTFVTGYEALNVGNVTSYQVTGLDPNKTYKYVVRALDANSESANSNEIEVTTLSTITWNGTDW
ncbi:fibronectin type III domain-containing protein, partial [Arthrospira platensis SPKY1]|nr:fibronectin type III domain-containing protein [Arthrospira platensis SPKY1]